MKITSGYLPQRSLSAQKVILVYDPCDRPAFPHAGTITDQIRSSVAAGEERLVLLLQIHKQN